MSNVLAFQGLRYTNRKRHWEHCGESSRFPAIYIRYSTFIYSTIQIIACSIRHESFQAPKHFISFLNSQPQSTVYIYVLNGSLDRDARSTDEFIGPLWLAAAILTQSKGSHLRPLIDCWLNFHFVDLVGGKKDKKKAKNWRSRIKFRNCNFQLFFWGSGHFHFLYHTYIVDSRSF